MVLAKETANLARLRELGSGGDPMILGKLISQRVNVRITTRQQKYRRAMSRRPDEQPCRAHRRYRHDRHLSRLTRVLAGLGEGAGVGAPK